MIRTLDGEDERTQSQAIENFTPPRGIVSDSAFSVPHIELSTCLVHEISIFATELRRIMKRKNDEKHAANGKAKKRALSEDDVKHSFRTDLFDTTALEKYKTDYAVSKPLVSRPCLIFFTRHA